MERDHLNMRRNKTAALKRDKLSRDKKLDRWEGTRNYTVRMGGTRNKTTGTEHRDDVVGTRDVWEFDSLHGGEKEPNSRDSSEKELRSLDDRYRYS
jgi:hypothetical protein